MNWLVALPVVLIVLAQFAGWRLYRALFVWRPAAAWLAGSDYREAESNFDRITHQGWLASEDADAHLTSSYLRFEDEDGLRHEVALTEWLARGRTPDTARTIWYDPANPQRFTRYGPGTWTTVLVGALVAVTWLFARGDALIAVAAPH